MSSIALRDAVPADVEGVAVVLHEGLLTAAELLGGFPRDHLRARKLATSIGRIAPVVEGREGHCIVAIETDTKRIVAFTIWSEGEQEAEIEMLYVLPELQNARLGSKVLNAALERIADAGIHKVRVLTMDWTPQSRRFYEREGFVRTGRSEPDTIFGSADENGNEVPFILFEYAKELLGDG